MLLRSHFIFLKAVVREILLFSAIISLKDFEWSITQFIIFIISSSVKAIRSALFILWLSMIMIIQRIFKYKYLSCQTEPISPLSILFQKLFNYIISLVAISKWGFMNESRISTRQSLRGSRRLRLTSWSEQHTPMPNDDLNSYART